MQLILSIPFRTTVNLQPKFVASRPVALIDALNTVAQQIDAEHKSTVVTTLQHHDEKRHGLYTSIDQDVLPACALPLLCASWKLAEIVDQTIDAPPGSDGATLESAQVHYYDHTLAILELLLTIETITDEFALASALDNWSFTLATQWISHSSHLTRTVEKTLMSTSVQGRDLCSAITKEDAYFDRQPVHEKNIQQELLWVSRVLILEKDASRQEWLRTWTQDSLDEKNQIALGSCSAILRVGNSVVFGLYDEDCSSAIRRALLLCNRFYAIAHVLGTNQRLIHGSLLGNDVNAEITGNITNAIRSRLDLLQHEYEEALLGIQGMRRLVTNTYMQTWGFDKLLYTCDKRLKSLEALVQSALQRRNLRYSRLVEAALTMIGGIALLDFAINLMNFSRTPGFVNDNWLGLVDVAQKIPEDALLYALLAIIFYLVYGKIRRP